MLRTKHLIAAIAIALASLAGACTPVHFHFAGEYQRLLISGNDLATALTAATEASPGTTDTTDTTEGENEGLQFMWFGTNSFHISDGETSILFDPFVSRYSLAHIAFRRRIPPKQDLVQHWLGKLQGPKPSHIFVSHSHFDHALDAPSFAKALSATIVGSASTRNIALGHGVPEDQTQLFAFGATVTVGKFRITAIESVHGAPLFGREPYPGVISEPVPLDAKPNQYRTGKSYSYIIEHPELAMISHGYGYVPQDKYRGRKVDYLLLTIAGRRDYDDFLDELLAVIQTDAIVPTHFDNFFRPLGKPIKAGPTVNFRKFVRAVEARPEPLLLQTFPIGEYVDLRRK